MRKEVGKIFGMGLLICTINNPLTSAQDHKDVSWVSPRPQDSAYYSMRERNNTPPFGLAKVKKLIDQRLEDLPDEALIDYDAGISNAEFERLTLEEKFTYTMIHPEVFSQACAERMFIFDPQRKIFGHLLFVYNGVFWSERQVGFMKRNKDRVIGWITDLTSENKELGLNYKSALVEVDAWESIPFLISFYKRKPEDLDVLTTLMLMMSKDKSMDFQQSNVFKKLYGKDANYDSWIALTTANEKYILETAQQYYQRRQGLSR
jgi:hypothetical protein